MDVLKIFVDHLAEPLGMLLAAVLSAFAIAGLKRLNRWLGIKGDEAQTRELLTVIQGAVDYAEQEAKRWARDGSPSPMPGGAKLDSALGFAMREAKRRGLPEQGAERLRDLIEAWLGGETKTPVAVVRLPPPPRLPGDSERMRAADTLDEELAPGEAP